MFEANLQHQQALRLTAEAMLLDADGRRSDALARLREAVLRYAEAARLRLDAEETPPPSWCEARAAACLRCGDWLSAAEAYSDAAGVYQEAADAYGSLPGIDAARNAQECARGVLASIAALRAHPQDRIYLLTRHYDRLQQQLALQERTEAQQAECVVHTAAVFLRRDRPHEAAERYRAAIPLYESAPECRETLLGLAECHHRLGGLLARALDDPVEAAHHYRSAIALYAAHEAPSFGRQQARDLCEQALRELDRQVQPDPPTEPRCQDEI